MGNAAEKASPIVAGPGEGETLWFMDFLVTVKSTGESTAGAVAVIDHMNQLLPTLAKLG